MFGTKVETIKLFCFQKMVLVLREFVEEFVRGGVEFFAVGVVGSVLKLLTNGRDLVGSNIVRFQGCQQITGSGQFEAVAACTGCASVGISF